jgi:hypothetical protein
MAGISKSGAEDIFAAVKTFPEFSKLTFDHKRAYEAFIADFPPVADIAFASLMTRWNLLDDAAISKLNGNLIISYWLPGDEIHSGLSLIGTSRIDVTMCELFDHMKHTGSFPRLVHVPEFVLKHIAYPDMFLVSPNPEYDECILSVSDFYPLANNASHRRRAISHFIDDVGLDNLITEPISLRSVDNQHNLLALQTKWHKQGTINYTVSLDYESTRRAIIEANSLGLKALGIYVNDELSSFCIYQEPSDSRYVILSHLKTDHTLPHMFDYMVYAYARWFSDNGYRFVNLEVDWGLSELRSLRMSLGPVDFLRKYTITPRNDVQESLVRKLAA